MFLKIIPILKLPRRFGAFDYRLPADRSFVVGDVIRVSFRRRIVLGVVASLEPASEENRVIEAENADPIFHISPEHLSSLVAIARELGQSPASILSIAYEGIEHSSPEPRRSSVAPKLSIDKETVETVKAMLAERTSAKRFSVAIDDETALVLAHALCKTAKEQTLIVVPRIRDAQRFTAILAPFAPSVLIGTTKSSHRGSVIRTWRNGSCKVLIGTRQATLIEPHHLETVLVFQAACEDHGSTLRNPHIDAVRTATNLATQTGSSIIVTDPLPPLNSVPLHPTPYTLPPPTIIDVTHKGENSAYPLLSQSLLESIKTALLSQKKVLLSFNRKGVAKRMECKACGHVPFCGTCGSLPTVRLDDLLCEACGSEMWKPTTCPACNSPKIGLRSIGGASIAAHLGKAFPEARIGTVQKGTIDLNADIILATEYFFSSVIDPFHIYNLGVVAEILADIGFTPGDYRGTEKTARKIARLQALAKREKAECILQTVARDRLVALLGTNHVTEQEQSIRKQYHLPPYGVIINFLNTTIDQLPEEIRNQCQERDEKITAKINHETYQHWQTIFPSLADSIDIRIEI
jgi:primosomal protein N'